MSLTAGIARTTITPYWGVELAGWGYYLKRTWERIHDDLNATALVLDNGADRVAIVSLDLLMISCNFTEQTRKLVAQSTDIPEHAILLTCSHSHNAPASGGLLGGGEVDPFYEQWASRQAATAVIQAWRKRGPAQLGSARGELIGHTFNRTREDGPVDTTLTILRIDTLEQRPIAQIVNFQAHPVVFTKLRPHEVTRDVPGQVCDLLESALPGSTAMYVQGACGDVNFMRYYESERRCGEPGKLVADAALKCHQAATPIERPVLAYAREIVAIPTRRWRQEEIDADRTEALRRISSGDTSGWRQTIGKVMTNRPQDMVNRHGGDEEKAVRAMARFNLDWTDLILQDYHDRTEVLETEVQAIRIGDCYIVANGSELFTTFALRLRNDNDGIQLMIACYSSDRIGYMPDAHDIARKTYAAIQSPKCCNQFPFTEQSGLEYCRAMSEVLARCRDG